MREILLMAAGGNQGRVLLPRLRDAGFRVRAFRETLGRDDELLALGAHQVFAGEATDRALLKAAMDGVDTIYHIGPTTNPLELEMGLAVAGVAEESGVGHFIYSSVLHTIATKLPQHRLKGLVEERILESNLDFTFLHPGDYMMPGLVQGACQTGELYSLFKADQGQSMVDLHDFADVVVKIANEREAHFSATYELCAPGLPSYYDIGKAITSVTGQPVRVIEEAADRWFERYYGHGSGAGYRYQSNVISACSVWYDRYVFRGNPNVLRWLLGREAISLEQFIEREWQLYRKEKGEQGGA